MAGGLPSTKQEFKDYIRRKLGGDFMPLELSNDNLEDIVQEAIIFFQENYYSFDRTVIIKLDRQSYLKDTDGNPKDSVYQYELGDNVFAVTHILRQGALGFPSSVFGTGTVPQTEVDFMFRTFTGQPVNQQYLDAEILLQNYQFVRDQFMDKYSWNFNHNNGILSIFNPMKDFDTGYVHLIAVVFDNLTDESTVNRYYQNKQFREYAVLLANQQMYNNLRKFADTELPGGVKVNIEAYKSEADKIADFEKDIIENYCNPELYTPRLESDF